MEAGRSNFKPESGLVEAMVSELELKLVMTEIQQMETDTKLKDQMEKYLIRVSNLIKFIDEKHIRLNPPRGYKICYQRGVDCCKKDCTIVC